MSECEGMTVCSLKLNTLECLGFLSNVVVAFRSGCVLSGFYRSRVFLGGNKHDIFFNVNAKKAKKAKCVQSNDKCILAAQIRAIGKSRSTLSNFVTFHSQKS